MEEQKDNKEVKLGVVKNENQDNNPPKYSYDELNKFCSEFYRENQYLKQQLQQASNTLRTIDRLDYLIRIVEADKTTCNWHFSASFMENCIQEIETIMTPPAEEQNKEEEN